MGLMRRLTKAGLYVGAACLWAASSWAQPAPDEKAGPCLPMGDWKCAHNIRCVVEKDTDRDFTITIRGVVGEGGAPVVVKRADGTVVLTATVPAGKYDAREIKVPKDGKTGQYVVLILTRDGKESFFGPLTDLPKEVYVMGYWIQNAPTRFYTRARGAQPESIEITPHKSAGKIESKDGKVLAESMQGETMKAMIGAEGAWISSPARYVDCAGPVTLALRAEAWFAPGEAAAAMKP